MSEPVEVWVAHGGEDVLAGRLWVARRGRGESATFVYDQGWVARSGAYPLQPALGPLTTAPFHTDGTRALFGAFADGAPDRWGRALMMRAARRRASARGRTSSSLGELDFLLGVRDDTRQGALRYRHPGEGAFLSPPEEGVPALIDLPELLAASVRFERDEAASEDVRLLLRAGSSLGGARPKAHVRDVRGRLALAKFPSVRTDDWDVMAWEKTALDIARSAGLRVSAASLHRVDGRNVLVVERFDRSRDGARIGYLSAMSLVDGRDGEPGSYLDLAETVEIESSAPEEDLSELWSRILLSVLISNTDDHLRNHGFLREGRGWRLAPLFDVNPNPDPGNDVLSTMIDRSDATASVSRLVELAGSFGLRPRACRAAIARVTAAVGRWRDLARANGVSRAEIARMEPAFDHDRRREADEAGEM
ncbi:MAG: type II toxin-antitoxin system HipA family toxin [Thermoleophilia bacterium]